MNSPEPQIFQVRFPLRSTASSVRPFEGDNSGSIVVLLEFPPNESVQTREVEEIAGRFAIDEAVKFTAAGGGLHLEKLWGVLSTRARETTGADRRPPGVVPATNSIAIYARHRQRWLILFSLDLKEQLFIKMTLDPRAQELADKIAIRRRQDTRWAVWTFVIAQIVVGAAVLASFGLAIATAFQPLPPVLVTILAAIPGTAIFIDYSFAFGRRSRWHHMMHARLELLENALRFENAPVEAISRAYGELFMEMEVRYPGVSANSLEFRPENQSTKQTKTLPEQ